MVSSSYNKDMLRPYQQEAMTKLTSERDRLGIGKSTVLALPTGSGKTLTAVAWIKDEYLDKGKRVLWWVHRTELYQQAMDCFSFVSPTTNVTSWTASRKDNTGQVVVAMILSSRQLLGRFDLIVIDEAHHRAMSTYENKEEELDFDFLLGLTATPTRLDDKDLRFDSIAAQQSMMELVADGYLAKPLYVRVRTGQRFKMRVNAGDFSGKSLGQLDNLARNELITEVWAKDRIRWGKCLVFCCNIEHAEHLETIMKNKAEELTLGPRLITCVHSKVPASQRRTRIARFRDGRAQVMLNVGVFTEGFDCPDINTIIMARPTASETLYCQMIGRGTRITDTKDAFFMIDFVDELGKYSLLARQWAMLHLGAEDLLAEEQQAEELAEAKTKMLDAGMSFDKRQKVTTEFVTFAGILEYRTQFSRGKQVMAATNELYEAWLKLNIILQTRAGATTDVIQSSYALTGASEAELPFAQWKDVAWATFFQSNNSPKGMVKFTPFRESKLEHDAMAKDIEEARQQNSTMNLNFASQTWKDWLLARTNWLVSENCYVDTFAHATVYNNQVITIEPNYRRESLQGNVRGQIRKLLVEEFSESLELDVQLVIRWPKAMDDPLFRN